MSVRLFVPLALAALAACSSPAEMAEKTGAESDQATAAASASSVAGKAVKVAEDNSTFSYEFSYPAAVGAIPALAAHIEREAAKAKAEMVAEAKGTKADAKKEGFPFNPHSLSEEWQVVADLPGYLSLSNNFATYSGGAHGMYGLSGYVWDKANGRGMDSAALFESPDHLGSALGQTLCDALNREREKKMGGPLDMSDGVFPPCPGLDEATILVGSSNGKTFDRITVWYGPYVAGSYAEGAYELDFPMTAAILDAVKPAYRAAFSAKR